MRRISGRLVPITRSPIPQFQRRCQAIPSQTTHSTIIDAFSPPRGFNKFRDHSRGQIGQGAAARHNQPEPKLTGLTIFDAGRSESDPIERTNHVDAGKLQPPVSFETSGEIEDAIDV